MVTSPRASNAQEPNMSKHDDHHDTIKCPHCGHDTEKAHAKCDHCGHSITPGAHHLASAIASLFRRRPSRES